MSHDNIFRRSSEEIEQSIERCSFYFSCIKCSSIRTYTVDNAEWGELVFKCLGCGTRVSTGVRVRKFDKLLPRGMKAGPTKIERLVKSGRPRK